MRGLLAAAVVVAVLPACGATEPETAGDTAVLQRYGITVEVPDGWDASLTHGALRAANFPLPAQPGRPLSEGQLLLQLFENDRRDDSPPVDLSLFPAADAVPTLSADDFGVPEPGTEQVEGLARRTFSVSGRLFVLFASSGSRPPSRAALTQLDELLGSIAVEPGDFYPGTVEPPHFTPREGWNVDDSGPRPVLADGNFVAAWASTIPYRDDWNATPQRTLDALPDDGIVVQIVLTTTNRFLPRFPDVAPPLRLADFERRAAWEGQIRDLPEYVLWGRVDGEYEINARVYFGRPEPTPEMRDEADAMLAGLRLPDWPRWDGGG